MTEITLAGLFCDERKRLAAVCDGKGDYANPVFGEGSISADTMFIGEAPGKDEAKEGRPFVGKAGAQLNRMLMLSGIDRERVYITNSVKFRPYIVTEKNGRRTFRNRKPDRQEIKDAAALLAREIEIISPSCIITLGNTPLSAVEWIFGIKAGKVGDVHGREIPLGKDMSLVPLYHPASGIYNRELVKVMEEDLINLGRKLRSRQE